MERCKVLAVTVLATLMPATAHAGTQTLAPAFDQAYASSECGSASVSLVRVTIPGTCSTLADARVNGAIDLQLSVRSPADETIPAPVSSYGSAYLYIDAELAPIRASVLLFRITMQVDQAAATTAMQSGPGRASLNVDASVSGQGMGAGTFRSLLDSEGESASSTIEAQELSIALALADGNSTMRQGRYFLAISMQAYAAIGTTSIGSASLDFRALITSVTVEALA